MYRKFFLQLVALGILLLAAAGIFNMVVDPYGIWHIYRRTGLNQMPHEAQNVERMIKPVEFLQKRPQTIFLGTSKSNVSMDPDFYEGLTGKTAYNFAVSGETIYEMRRYLEYAAAVDPNLQEAIVEVNFLLFVQDDLYKLNRTEPGFDEQQLKKRGLTLKLLEKTLFSSQACKDSFLTISENQQNQYEHAYFKENGQVYEDSTAELHVRANLRYEDHLSMLQNNGPRAKHAQISEDSMKELERLVEFCRTHNIKLTLFIPPGHAEELEMIAQGWDLYHVWRKQIVQIAPVMDFKGYNSVTTSSIDESPGILGPYSNAYFWDSEHMKTEAADMVLACIAGQDIQDMPAGFGQWMTSENVEEIWTRLNTQRDAWQKKNMEWAERAWFFSGFYDRMPVVLSGSDPIRKKSVIRLNLPNGATRAALDLRQDQYFELSGLSLSCQDQLREVYAVLEDGNGQRYYSRANSLKSPDAVEFLKESNYDRNSFYLHRRVDNVPAGTYTLYIVECSRTGDIYLSEPMGSVVIHNN